MSEAMIHNDKPLSWDLRNLACKGISKSVARDQENDQPKYKKN